MPDPSPSTPAAGVLPQDQSQDQNGAQTQDQTTSVVWDPAFTRYNFGPGHPMSPVRLDLTARLCEELGLFAQDDVVVVNPPVASDEELATVHAMGYVQAVRHAGEHPDDADQRFGIGTEDDPAFVGMHEASARIVGGTLAVTKDVWTGRARHGVNFCGGMHHAMPDRAAGFCIYNDASVAIEWLLAQGVERIAYIDIDVHHGDGVERCHWNDPRVMTCSIHETGRVLFPGTGFPGDIGGPDAMGTAVNVALPPGTGDAAWLRALHASIVPLVRAFNPQVLITQQGCDSHFQDPLAHLAISVDAQRQAMEALHRLSHELCDGRWIALGGGGYEVVEVVPRSWTHLTGIASHHPIRLDTDIPPAWNAYVQERYDVPGPTVMNDGVAEGGVVWWRGWESGYNPEDPVDRAVMATREALFPLYGLDVWFD